MLIQNFFPFCTVARAKRDNESKYFRCQGGWRSQQVQTKGRNRMKQFPYWQPVIRLGTYAYKTGTQVHKRGKEVSNECWAEVRLAIVRACVDAVPRNRGRVFLGKRRALPGKEQPDWWYIGGGMEVGDDTTEAALLRIMQRELGLSHLNSSQFTYLCNFLLQWPKSVDLSLLHVLELSDEEAAQILVTIDTKEEYIVGRWFTLEEVISHPQTFHPVLVQVCEILRTY